MNDLRLDPSRLKVNSYVTVRLFRRQRNIGVPVEILIPVTGVPSREIRRHRHRLRRRTAPRRRRRDREVHRRKRPDREIDPVEDFLFLR